MAASRALSVCAFGACALVARAEGVEAAPAAALAPVVSTVAGSGIAGHADGAAGSSRMIAPFALAVAADGTIYVADAADQSIRRIDPSGRVDTVAGGAGPMLSPLYRKGGYVDGPAASAQFDRPSGIALGPAGELYVADTLNHCIRKIAHGVVTTFAGTNVVQKAADGARDAARFEAPVSLASDDAGRLVVGDVSDGVRLVGIDGSVRTISNLREVRGLAIARDALGRPVVVAAEDGGLTEFREDGTPLRRLDAYATPVPTQGKAPVGHPFAVAALSPDHVVVSDVRSGNLREYVFSPNDAVPPSVRVLAGSDAEDAGGNDLDDRDGPARDARFEMPAALALGRGGLLIADAGAHVLRRLSAWNERTFDGGLAPRAPGQYRLALVGNSFVWWDTDFDRSIAGRLENDLDRDLATTNRTASVSSFVFSSVGPDAVRSLIENELSGGAVDGIVYLVNSFSLIPYLDQSLWFADRDAIVAKWHDPALADFVAIRRAAADAGIPLLVVYHPFPEEYSSTEAFAATIPNEQGYSHASNGAALRGVLQQAFPDVLDLWPDFVAHDAVAGPALFQAFDKHFTPVARDLVAARIERYLASHPDRWLGKRP